MGYDKRERRSAGSRGWAVALLLCLFFALACHGRFVFSGKAFVTEGDSLRQMVASQVLLDRAIGSGDGLLWSDLYGLGGELYGSMSFYYTTSPFYYLEYGVRALLGIAGDPEGILALKVWFSVLRMALACFLTALVLRREGHGWALSLLAGFFYGAGSRFMYFSLVFDFMTPSYLMPPLILLGYDEWIRSGKARTLVVAMALTFATNFYFAFINAAFAATAFLVLPLRERMTGRDYLKRVALSAMWSAAALLLSAAAFIPAVRAFLRSDRGLVSADWSLLPARSFVSALWHGMYGYGTYLVFPVALFACVPAVLGRGERNVRARWALFLFWLAAWCVPAAKSVMNGFSFPSDRFLYLAAFAASYAIPDSLEALHGVKRKAGFLPALTVALFVLGTIIRKAEPGSAALRFWYYPMLAVTLAFCAAIGAYAWKGQIPKRTAPVCAGLAASCLALVCCGSFAGSYTLAEAAERLSGDGAAESVYASLGGTDLPGIRVYDARDTDGELRTENRSFVTGVPGAACYMSLLDGNLHSRLKRTLQVRTSRVESHYYRGLDDRRFLETVWNIAGKIIGDPSAENVACEPETTPEGIVWTRLRDLPGIDLWYPVTVDSSLWEAMPVAEKDALMVTAAAIPGGERDLPAVGTEWILRSAAGAEAENCAFSDGILWVEEGGGTLRAALPERANGEYLVTLRLRTERNEPFTFRVNGKETEKIGAGYPADYDQDSFTVRVPCGTEEVVVEVAEGVYPGMEMEIGFNSYDGLPERVKALNACGFEELSYRPGRVRGRIDCPEDGVLALSVPYDDGWTCRVDGARAEVLQVNGFFPGVRLGTGEHTVEFRYVSLALSAGVAVSLLTAASLALAAIRTGKRRGRK